jgi:hypothetical protein
MPANTDHLLQNESLGPDQLLTSANGRYTFVYQGDCNLVLYKNYWYKPRRALWSSQTNGRSVGNCIMQADGNLVIYDPQNVALWASATMTPQSRLVVQDDGNVVIYRPNNTPIWATNTVQPVIPTSPVASGDTMHPSDVLTPETWISSANGAYYLVYQSDGNLVLYSNRFGKALWASNTAGQPGESCVMQPDGNLVIYDGDGHPLWASNTNTPGSRLVMQDDANAVIYRPNTTPVWASKTDRTTPPSTIKWPWAIILCLFNDKPQIPQPADYYADLYTRNGAGGIADYWREVSMNTIDMTDSKVFGWFTMKHASAELQQLVFPGNRSLLVQWGIDTAVANGVNLAAFKQILVVQNFGVDHGFAGNGVLIVHQNPSLCEFGFISHETGHGFGLPHSFAANPDREYFDGWDVMSFATTTFQFPIAFRDTQGQATVGINARNLEALDSVPQGRMWMPNQPDFSAQLTLDAMNQPPIGNNGILIAKIGANATRPRRQNLNAYTIEFRRNIGWDRATPQNAVLIHEVRTDERSYLQPTVWGQFTAGQQFVTPDPKVFVRVVSIDAATGTASIRVWDLPEGGLRKEDSKPAVYLIENGTKRWVTSPQALFALGKGWNDVRVVPDSALSNVPAGPDIV